MLNAYIICRVAEPEPVEAIHFFESWSLIEKIGHFLFIPPPPSIRSRFPSRISSRVKKTGSAFLVI